VSNVIAISCDTCGVRLSVPPHHVTISIDGDRQTLLYPCLLCHAAQTRDVCAATAGLLLDAGTSLDVVIPDECPTL